MLKTKVEDALNVQINREFESAYIYLGMAAYCESVNLEGCGHWFQVQAREELGHGMKIYKYLCEQGAAVKLTALPEPKAKYASIKEVFEGALSHEKKITASLQSLYRFAAEEQDFTTQTFLGWFLTEQVEEEAHASKILEKINMAGAQGAALLFLDAELGKRG
jgi:ferritin